ncbi:MAG: LamG domain-containing protein [Planctomycetota bacterium]|jgi:hypothetical protein
MGTKGYKILAAVLGLLAVCGSVLAMSVHFGLDELEGAPPCGLPGLEVHGEPVWVQGQVGTALKFNGEGDYLELRRIPWLTSEQTKALWLCVDELSREHDMYVIDEGGEGNNNWIELVDFDRDGISQVRAGFDGENYIDSSPKIKPGYWNHIAVASQMSGELAIYINGRLDTAQIGLSAKNQPEEIVIATDSGTKEAFFKGIIDEVSIHARPLSAGEIEQLYKAGLVGRVYTVNPEMAAAQNIRSAIAAKQQALSSINEALNRESALNNALQTVLDSARATNFRELARLTGAMEKTEISIAALQQSRAALEQSMESLKTALTELQQYYKGQGIDIDLSGQSRPFKPPVGAWRPQEISGAEPPVETATAEDSTAPVQSSAELLRAPEPANLSAR